MNKCLITKLSGVVNNNNLLTLNEYRFSFDNLKNGKFRVDVNSDTEIKVMNGEFTNEAGTQHQGTSLVRHADETTSMYVTAGATVCIMNKYNVKNIDLSNSNIKDFDLNSLKFFTNLTSLSLQSTSATGDISSLSGLTNLTSLSLQSTSVIGDINALSGLVKLTTLIINSTSITGNISSLSGLVKLTTLIINSTSVIGDINSLSGLTNLTNLSIYSTSITGNISSLSGLTKLTTLKCSNVTVSGELNALGNLTKLSTLYIDNTSITGDIKSFCNLLKNTGKISGTLNINANNSSATFEGVSKDVIATFTASSISYSDK